MKVFRLTLLLLIVNLLLSNWERKTAVRTVRVRAVAVVSDNRIAVPVEARVVINV